MTRPQLKPAAPALAFDTSDRSSVRHPYDRHAELRESPELHRDHFVLRGLAPLPLALGILRPDGAVVGDRMRTP